MDDGAKLTKSSALESSLTGNTELQLGYHNSRCHDWHTTLTSESEGLSQQSRAAVQRRACMSFNFYLPHGTPIGSSQGCKAFVGHSRQGCSRSCSPHQPPPLKPWKAPEDASSWRSACGMLQGPCKAGLAIVRPSARTRGWIPNPTPWFEGLDDAGGHEALPHGVRLIRHAGTGLLARRRTRASCMCCPYEQPCPGIPMQRSEVLEDAGGHVALPRRRARLLRHAAKVARVLRVRDLPARAGSMVQLSDAAREAQGHTSSIPCYPVLA